MAAFEALPINTVTQQMEHASAEFEIRMSALDGADEAALSNVAEKIHLAQLILEMRGIQHTGSDVVCVAAMIFRQIEAEAGAAANAPETAGDGVVGLGVVRAH